MSLIRHAVSRAQAAFAVTETCEISLSSYISSNNTHISLVALLAHPVFSHITASPDLTGTAATAKEENTPANCWKGALAVTLSFQLHSDSIAKTQSCLFSYRTSHFTEIVALKQLFPKIGSSPGFPRPPLSEICQQMGGCPCLPDCVTVCLCFWSVGQGTGH